MSTTIVAEAGINHNGSVELAKDLVKTAYLAGCDNVKFQKRTPEVCVPEEQKSVRRWTPWGEMDYIEYKKRIELSREQIAEVFRFGKRLGIDCFSSVWDVQSVEDMSDLMDVGKIPSALITNTELLKAAREAFPVLVISTGMSTEDEIEKAVDVADPDVIMHSVSSYPSDVDELDLRYIRHLNRKFPELEVGYSGHETQVHTAASAVSLGSDWIERHITLDSNAWGSDQSASLEPDELSRMVKVIRETEDALGDKPVAGVDYRRRVRDSEKAKRRSLRGE
jgi:N-acetylneuraminate synthase